MRKIAVSLSKGGVGKTTTAVNLSAGLAVAGHKVLLIDADTQGHAGAMLGVVPERNLADVLDGTDPRQAIIEIRENLFLLAGGAKLAGAKRLIARKDYGGEYTLAEALSKCEGQFDFVILDTAPGWDPLAVNVLFYSTEILAPVSLEVLTLIGMAAFTESIEAVRKYNHEIQLKYVLPTFFDRRVKKSKEILKQLSRHYLDELCDPICYNVRLSEAPGFKKTIYEYDARSQGAKDYLKLVRRVLDAET